MKERAETTFERRTVGLRRPLHNSTATACMAVANIVKSSLGPVGLDKMLVGWLRQLFPI